MCGILSEKGKGTMKGILYGQKKDTGLFYPRKQYSSQVKARGYIRLSQRSRMPPWPGKIFPKSFTPATRLTADILRSPHWLRMEQTPAYSATAQAFP